LSDHIALIFERREMGKDLRERKGIVVMASRSSVNLGNDGGVRDGGSLIRALTKVDETYRRKRKCMVGRRLRIVVKMLKTALLAYLHYDIRLSPECHRTYRCIQGRTLKQSESLEAGYEMHEVCWVLMVAWDVMQGIMKTKVEKSCEVR
jgi:hypothetical protein